MMLPLRILFLALSLFVPATLLPAQSTDAGADSVSPGTTVITSDELHSDQINHTSVFSGNVVVTGSSFNMTCDEMKVLFSKDGKVDHIIASGNVVITQPGRTSHSGQVDYYRDEDKFVLTDQPEIVDNKNRISAPKITIYRTNQTLQTEGKPCKVVLINDGGAGNSSSGSLPK